MADCDGVNVNPVVQTDVLPILYPHCEEGDKLRRRLKFFFMNPCEKWRAKRQFPWKLGFQLVKIILVTTQLALFGFDRGAHVDFLEKSNTAFKHLFLFGWEPAFETMPYPPATGAFAVYTIPDFYKSVNFALRQYNLTELLAIGTYHFTSHNDSKPPMKMCNTYYRLGKIEAHNESYIFDDTKVTDCFKLYPLVVYNSTTHTAEAVYDVEKLLESLNKTINFDSIIRVTLKFAIKTVHLRKLSRIHTPDCFKFYIQIEYDNSLHNGQMTIQLTNSQDMMKCNGKIVSDVDEGPLLIFISIFDVVVIVVSLASLVLCCRSLGRGHKLRKTTMKFFKEKLNRQLDLSSQLEFVNFWYIMIVVNDVMTIIGSGLKIRIENKESTQYEVCGVLLGTGNLLVWFGVLRYLGFFEKYNILILTMKKSAPNILRFLVCAGVFYFGFTVCGWVVLGPYHIKFRSASASMECLFALINGDDLFNTFANLNAGPSGSNMLKIWWFSRLYIYSFVTLFIYVILNLFLAVILDAYIIIKFRTLAVASECLFALVNGDELYITFATIQNSNTYIWWYSRIFLYVFISFFIYVVLSVFISVIMDTYETIKDYYENGFPKTELQRFYEQITDEPHNLFPPHEKLCTGSCLCGWVPSCNICPRRQSSSSEVDSESIEEIANERAPLIT